MKKIKIIAALSALVLLSSCRSEEPDAPAPPTPEQPVACPMAFGTTTSGETLATRDAATNNFTNLYNRFAVWAWKSAGGSEQKVMNHDDMTPYEVVWGADGKWHYDISMTAAGTAYQQFEKFWDLASSQYDFMAFAPFRNPDTDTGDVTQDKITYTPANHRFAIGGIRGNTSTDTPGAIHWLRAHTRRNMATPADFDMMASATEKISPDGLVATGDVPLVFHFLQPVIEIRAYTTCGSDLTASDITFDLSNSTGSEAHTVCTLADYAIGPDDISATWTLSTADGTKESNMLDLHTPTLIKDLSDPADLADRRNKSTLLTELYEIPQDISAFFANIKVTTTLPTNHYGILPMGDGWESDKRYIYYIIINPGEEYIVMDVSVDVIPWQKGDDIDAGEVNNW